MNSKTFVILLSLFICTTAHAQKKKKCAPVFDKELGMEVYHNVDADTANWINSDAAADTMTSENFRFKTISKKYPEDQMVRIAYVTGTDGKPILIKVLSPVGDKEIDEEAKRLVNMLPFGKPCKCNGEPVPCSNGLNMRLYPRKK
jgi:hypothetical protein